MQTVTLIIQTALQKQALCEPSSSSARKRKENRSILVDCGAEASPDDLCKVLIQGMSLLLLPSLQIPAHMQRLSHELGRQFGLCIRSESVKVAGMVQRR